MKKKLFYIFWIACGCMLLSLGLGTVFISIKMFSISGACFIIFFISMGIFIFTSLIAAIIGLCKQIKAKGWKQTILSIVKWFGLLFIFFMFGSLIFKHKNIADAIWFSAFYSTVMAFIMNFLENGVNAKKQIN